MTNKIIEQSLQLAQILQQEGKLEDAIIIYRQTIKKFPQHCQLYNYLAKALIAQGNSEAAIAILHQGINLKQNFSWFYYHLGESYKQQGDFKQAIVSYQQAIKLESNVYWFYYHLAEVFKQQGDFNRAIDNYQQAIELGMENPWVYHHLGQCWADKGDVKAAIASYRQAIVLNPNVPTFYENIYWLQRNLAQENLPNKDNINDNFTNKNQLKSQVSRIKDLQNKATFYLEQKQLKLALECYQAIIEINSDYGRAIYQIGNIYQQLNQEDTAQKFYHQASILEDFTAESDVLCVYFSARHLKANCRFHFLDLVAGFPGKKLFVRDLQDAWYLKGLSGLTENIEQTANYLQQLIAQQDLRKVVFFGASSGGYAALLLGCLLDVDEIHAFGAQTKIPSNPEEIKLLEQVESPYFDLAQIYYSRTISSKCHLYFDTEFPPDVQHANNLQGIASVELHSYQANIGHRITLWLKHQDLLKPIILNALN